MSIKRLQVLLPESEMRELRKRARRNGQTVAAWVRNALHAAADQEPTHTTEHKLAVLRAANQHSFPSGDVNEMLRQIESGYREPTE